MSAGSAERRRRVASKPAERHMIAARPTTVEVSTQVRAGRLNLNGSVFFLPAAEANPLNVNVPAPEAKAAVPPAGPS